MYVSYLIVNHPGSLFGSTEGGWTDHENQGQPAAEAKQQPELQLQFHMAIGRAERSRPLEGSWFLRQVELTVPGVNTAGVWATTGNAMDAILCTVGLFSLGVSSCLLPPGMTAQRPPDIAKGCLAKG